MSSLNKFLGIGRVGQEPKVHHGQSGVIVNASIAASESWKDKTTGEKKESTEWINIVFYGKLAEIAERYLAKGSLVYVEGKLKTRKWQDKNGMDRYTTEVNVSEMKLLGPKPEQPAPASSPDDLDVPF